MCNECNLCGFLTGEIRKLVCPRERMALTSLHWEPLGKHGALLERIRSRAHAHGTRLIISSSYVGGYLPCQDQNRGVRSEHGGCKEIDHFDYINIHGPAACGAARGAQRS